MRRWGQQGDRLYPPGGGIAYALCVTGGLIIGVVGAWRLFF